VEHVPTRCLECNERLLINMTSMWAKMRMEISAALLAAVAVVGLAISWWLYPAENHFSIMRCTISFLGSPDANRNPNGWRFYQVGMTALAVLLFRLAAVRHRRLRVIVGRAAVGSSGLIFIAFTLLLVVVWIPDSRETGWFGLRTGQVHTRMAILAIPILGFGIAVDAIALWVCGVNWRKLWPFQLYGVLAITGTVLLAQWEGMCRRDPTLPHWPGRGLHSTPLWEWIMFTYLIGFMIWLAHGRLPVHKKSERPRERTVDSANSPRSSKC